MTQPNKPGPSWEKEAEQAAEDFAIGKMGKRHAVEDWVLTPAYNGYEKGFIEGARWAQEKAANHAENNASNLRTAPEESEWGKIADTYFNSRFEHGRRNYDAIAPGDAWDTAIDRIARPLLAEKESYLKEANTSINQLFRMNDECDELKAEVASLREELTEEKRLHRVYEETADKLAEECITLRASLAECVEKLDYLVSACEFESAFRQEEPHKQVVACRAFIAKLRGEAPAAVEGKDG